jgi:hypothetical protein
LSRAYWARPLYELDLDRHIAEFLDELGNWGDPRYFDELRDDGVREFRAEVIVPTFEHPGVRLIYDESYVPDGAEWGLAEYCYNFMDLSRRRFFGFHHHPVPSIDGRTPVTHQHCRQLDDVDRRHYRGAPVDLIDAHYAFVTWAADPAQYPDCRSLRPIERD